MSFVLASLRALHIDQLLVDGVSAWTEEGWGAVGKRVSLPSPVAVTYEAGPTGFGLARFLTEQEIGCLVAAPSKLQRPAWDRVKTDVRDARHLARLLHLGEIVAVAVPVDAHA